MEIQESFYQLENNHKIFYRYVDHQKDSLVVIVHGLGEHQGRHHYFGDLSSHKANLLYFDLRGHGKSSGKAAYIDSFKDFSEDLESMINFFIKEKSIKSYKLFGHSMGGLVVMSFLTRKKDKTPRPDLIYLSSPALGVSGLGGKIVNRMSSNLVSKLAGFKLGTYIKGVLDLKKISHDKDVYTSYLDDPLNHIGVHSRLLLSIADETKFVKDKFRLENETILGSIGDEDVFVSVGAVKEFFDKFDITKQLRIFEGAYHEIHNEIPTLKEKYLKHLKRVFLEA